MIAPRPWWNEREYVAAHVPNGRPNGEVIGKFIPSVDRLVDGVSRTENASHAVACVNAIHAAGISPAALADPKALKRLVEAARSVVRDGLCNCCYLVTEGHATKCGRSNAEKALRDLGLEPANGS